MQALHEKEKMQHESFTSKTTQLKHKEMNESVYSNEDKEAEFLLQTFEQADDILIQSVTSVPFISPSMNCERVLELFREQPEHECIVIVDEEQQPIGLVMRNALFIKLSLPLVRELYSQRPIIKLTDTNPLIVDVHTELYDIVKQALGRTGTHLYDCVIVCDGKRVQGVLTMSDLLKLSTALQNQSKEAQYHLISSSKRTIKRIVEEVEQVHAAVQVSEHKSETMVDMTLEGKNVLQKLTDTVAIISSNAKQQQSQMEQLQLGAATIQNVTKLVQELSEQSNLLAINASIEAARAGAHGRSFGVVASEMMNLASQTKRYAVQIKDTIEQIVTAIHDTKHLTERGAVFSIQSDEMITNAESIFQDLFKMVAQNKQELQHIDQQAQLANEQAQATMNELNKLSELHK
ncbi:methyl-accepting chemotaxis protein [Paenibacillus sp. FSL W7-1287]|uniref:methyl-accepting chemotaxis protein n=1 Tax=Paenibacillus sp. FSL W7-1287 TaxID=2954538 RepID=UPI0030FBEE16